MTDIEEAVEVCWVFDQYTTVTLYSFLTYINCAVHVSTVP
jgi:hypothetical protein